MNLLPSAPRSKELSEASLLGELEGRPDGRGFGVLRVQSCGVSYTTAAMVQGRAGTEARRRIPTDRHQLSG
jgi:hypothetical protein